METRQEQMTKGGLDGHHNFIGDDSEFRDWFGILGQSRDSDALERSNFTIGLELLGGESNTVRVERFGHWAVGWIEEIYVKPGSLEADIAAGIERNLADYPVLDDMHYSEIRWTEATDLWGILPISERVELCQREGISIFEARHNWVPQSDNGGIFEYLTTP